MCTQPVPVWLWDRSRNLPGPIWLYTLGGASAWWLGDLIPWKDLTGTIYNVDPSYSGPHNLTSLHCPYTALNNHRNTVGDPKYQFKLQGYLYLCTCTLGDCTTEGVASNMKHAKEIVATNMVWWLENETRARQQHSSFRTTYWQRWSTPGRNCARSRRETPSS